MKKREQGVLTVEASIVLTVCILFILFLFSFARIYSAQSMVGHAVIQASDAIALESYFREETRTGSEADVTELANRFLGTTSITADNYTSLRSADVPAIAREKFILAIDSNEAKADEKLRRLGVKDGISGIDFSRSNIELGPDDVIVHVTYKLEMQFSVFGMNEITVTKAAKSKTFGDILFDIEVAPENSLMGETNGSGNFRQGRSIRISATPKYGYKFKQWSDGNTDNPRTVTVSGTGRYVAIFEESAFGVNLVSSPSSGGQVTGGGEYKYQQTSTITATASEGYHFVRWSIYSHKDKTTRNVTASTTTIHVDQSYTATAYFERNSYTAMVETSGASGTANFIYKGEVKTNAAVLYNDTIRLSAPDISGYKLLGWKEQDGDRYFSTSAIVDVSMPAKNVTYVACYESLSRTVNFYNYDGSLYATRTVDRKSTRLNSSHHLTSRMPSSA